ncbi:MAG: LysM peptidoglycan-binding domain-containing protein [Methylococcaceae bacterium]
MHVNFNRRVNFLLILPFLIVAGCSETSKAPLDVNENAAVEPYQENVYSYHPNRTYGKLKFKSPSSRRGHYGQYNTVWERLFSLYSLPEIENPRIDREVDWYLQHPASLAIIQQRAEPYLHLILDEIEAKNIPGELALLPVVESAFVPDAYSKADASGLWQFIPSTGEEYGLEQNAWYDGRRDVYASTQAATTYLKELSETFDGDWLLALASYNCGKGNVRKSIEKNEDRYLPTDYWSLSLPEETLDYVPRLLAISKIFAHAEEYNIHLQHIPNKPYLVVVDIKSPLDLHKAAQLANTPFDKFLKLNPGFNRSCTAPQGPHRLLVPIEQAQSFKRNLAELPYAERVNLKQYFNEVRTAQIKHDEEKVARIRHDDYKLKEDKVKVAAAQNEQIPETSSRYKVRAGESLSAIAIRNHTTIKSLRQANHLASNSVRSGMVLQIPSTTKSAVMPLIAKATISKNKYSSGQLYAVKKGDTFWNISQRFSVTPKDIAEWNNITLKTALVPGRKLTIKTANQQLASASPAIRLIRYTVGKGDSLTQIARKFNVTVTDLRKSNSDTLIKGLRPGQKLKILVDGQSST